MPAATVAVDLCGEDSAEETGETINQKKQDILSTFKRRACNRISFKGESGPLLTRYRQARFSSRRVRKRVVFKHGDCNVVQGNVAKRRRRYLQDIFTTLVDAQWRWTLLVFSMNFLLSWLGFALIWWLIAYSHGDLDFNNYNNHTFIPCVEDIRSFTSCFLFSVETQHTIGYGAKHTTDECPEAIFTLCIQSMTGVILQAFMVGIVFAKLSRPKKRTQTLLFSRNAVICQRDGQSCLMFRVGDMRKSHIIEAHVRAQMIKRKITKEGELVPFFQTELKVGGDGEEDKIFFIWPTTIVHKIDRHSPLSSNDSLTMTSGSSLGSSTGGLHMQVPAPATPANSIPVITAPDGSCKSESINMHSDLLQSRFYAQNEMTKEEYDIENSKDQNYDSVIQNISAALWKSKEQNGEENRMQENESKSTLDSRRSEKTNSRRSITEEDEESTLKKLSCKSNPDISQRNLADSTEMHPSTFRRSSLCDDYKVTNVPKKISFAFKEKTLTHFQNTSSTEQA